MVRYIQIFLYTLVAFAAPLQASMKQKIFPKEGDFILTYPRSGTHLTSAYIQGTTATSFRCLNGWVLHTFLSSSRFARITGEGRMFHTHFGGLLEKYNCGENKLLFILRNYKESIVRHTRGDRSDESVLADFANNRHALRHYMKNLAVYDAWDPSRRLLVYYEDILRNPLQEVPRILEFLGKDVPENFGPELLAEISRDSLAFYEVRLKSHSKGADVHYHSKKMPPHYLNEIDSWVSMYYPDLFQAYLTRYLSPIEEREATSL